MHYRDELKSKMVDDYNLIELNYAKHMKWR